MRHNARAAGVLSTVLVFSALPALGGDQFETPDPLKAFVREEYALGSDYFIRGKDNTVLFRCILTKPEYAYAGIALSEQSIWGNRGGDWEVFRKNDSGVFVYVGTRRIENTACLESCLSSEYLASGHCTWQHGWKAR